jgi:hypothetical protein
MVDIFDVFLPIVSLIAFALLTIPVFRAIRKTQHKTASIIVWFSTIFLVSGAAVANLAAKYYSLASPQPFLNITLTETPFA